MESKTLQSVLQDNDHKITEPRRLLFKALEGAASPLSFAQIQELVTLTNRATLYRNLAMFESLNIVKKVWFGGNAKYELSEEFKAHHHHIVCEVCNDVEKVNSKDLEKMLRKVTKKAGFKLTNHHLELIGRCSLHFEA